MSQKLRPTDREFSRYIKHRDSRCVYGIRCVLPVNFEQLQASHFKGRWNENLRFDPDNCDAACPNCHRWVTDTGEGKRWLRRFKEKQLGKERFMDILRKAHQETGDRNDKKTMEDIRKLMEKVLKYG